jgi:hypothetical protein
MALGREISFIGKGGPSVFKAGVRGANITARTQAFINALALDGVTLSGTIISALNTFDLALISAGLLPAGTGAGIMKAIYPFVGGSATAHKYNFVDPRDLDAAYRLQFIGGVTHDLNGATPNGVNGVAKTFFNNNTLERDSTHISYYSRTNVINSEIEMGAYESSNGSYILFNYSNLAFKAINSSEIVVGNLADPTTGLYIANRNNSTNVDYLINNSINTYNRNSVPLVNREFALFCYNSGPPLSNSFFGFSSKQAAMASIGLGMNTSQMTNFNNSVNAFQTTLGRNV